MKDKELYSLNKIPDQILYKKALEEIGKLKAEVDHLTFELSKSQLILIQNKIKKQNVKLKEKNLKIRYLLNETSVLRKIVKSRFEMGD